MRAFTRSSSSCEVSVSDRPHIVILARGNSTWLGGRQYSLNLLRALIAYREQKDTYDLSVLVGGKEELAVYEPLRPKLRECLDSEPIMPGWTFRNRVRWKIKRTCFGWINPQVEEVLLRLGASFVYPASIAKIDWRSGYRIFNIITFRTPLAAPIGQTANSKPNGWCGMQSASCSAAYAPNATVTRYFRKRPDEPQSFHSGLSRNRRGLKRIRTKSEINTIYRKDLRLSPTGLFQRKTTALFSTR